jgi:hypothetical protein
LWKAVDRLRGYKEALSLAEDADAWLRSLRPVPPVPAELDPHRCGKLSEEWLTAAAEHEAAAARLEHERRLILTVRQRAGADANAAFLNGIDHMLADLHHDLMGMLDNVADIANQLNGATTAAQAVEVDAGAAWKRLAELTTDYQTLRAAQHVIMLRAPRELWISCTPTLGGEPHANLAYIRNIGSIWANWRQPGLGPQRINIDGSKPRPEPWPTDPTQVLLWLVTSSAEPWIPTTRELRQRFREPSERANPGPDDEPQQQPEPPRNEPPRNPYDRIAAPIGASNNERPDF